MEPPEEENNPDDMEEPFGKGVEIDNYSMKEKLKELENETQNNSFCKKRKICQKFPSSFIILFGFEIFAYILTFIIQKGKFSTLEYSKENFIIKYPNETTTTIPASEEILKGLNIKIPFQNFINGLITAPVSIPNTYEKINGENVNFFFLFINPIRGVVNSMDISFFVMIIAGCINILVNTKAMDAGIQALIRLTKGKEFILLCITFTVFAICGTTIGMIEQSFCFYPILMPVFLKSNIDGMLAAFSIYPATMVGSMFALSYPASVVLASYLSGIHFTDGIVFRLISLIFAIVITFGYFYYYHRKVRLNPRKSFCYNIKEELENQFLRKEEKRKDNKKKKEEEDNNEIENNNEIEKNDEIEKILSNEGLEDENNMIKFTWTRIVSLLVFFAGFIMLVIGVSVFDWYFEEMSALFFGISIILMILSGESQENAISFFTKGAGDIISVCLVIGVCRGIYYTLDQGKINDSILYGLSSLFEGVPKEVFAIIMIFVFLILGFFIPSGSGLATLSMPIFSPLADVANVPRHLVINAYMFSQRLLGIISPTSLLLIACQLSGIPFNIWVKFVFPYCLIMLVYLLVLILINTTL